MRDRLGVPLQHEEAERSAPVAQPISPLVALARMVGDAEARTRAPGPSPFRPQIPQLARYRTVSNYTPGGGDGTLFESQALDVGSGAYTRTRRGKQHGLFVSETDALDASGTAPAWNRQSTSQGNMPPLKVSQNNHFAVEDTGQPRTIFVQDALIDGINDHLEDKQSPYRLNRSGMQITLPAAGATPAVTLTQASAVPQDKKDVVAAKFENLETEKLNMMQVECNLVAQKIAGEGDPTTIPVDATKNSDAAAAPAPGQIYQYQNRSTAEKAAGTRSTVDDMPWKKPSWYQRKFKGAQVRTTFADALAQLRSFDERMAQMNERYSMLHAMQNVGGMSDEAKSLLPGWGNHYEAVIAADGPDTVTLANYNRNAEAGWVVGHELRRAMREHKVVYTRFKALYEASAAKMNQPTNQFDPVVFAQMMKQDIDKIFSLMQAHAPEGAARAARIRDGARGPAGTMWYFGVYGPANQSFHETFQRLGGRGITQGETTVVGRPAVPKPVVPPVAVAAGGGGAGGGGGGT